jgi:arginine:pyruvate transaminase
MQALIQPGVKAVVVNFPHNPTGALLGAAEWGQLVDACRAAGAWLFSDEMYRFAGKLARGLI